MKSTEMPFAAAGIFVHRRGDFCALRDAFYENLSQDCGHLDLLANEFTLACQRERFLGRCIDTERGDPGDRTPHLRRGGHLRRSCRRRGGRCAGAHRLRYHRRRTAPRASTHRRASWMHSLDLVSVLAQSMALAWPDLPMNGSTAQAVELHRRRGRSLAYAGQARGGRTSHVRRIRCRAAARAQTVPPAGDRLPAAS